MSESLKTFQKSEDFLQNLNNDVALQFERVRMLAVAGQSRLTKYSVVWSGSVKNQPLNEAL